MFVSSALRLQVRQTKKREDRAPLLSNFVSEIQTFGDRACDHARQVRENLKKQGGSNKQQRKI